MKRRTTVLLALSAVLLTGCITLEIQTVINPDGSGEKAMVMALDQDTYDMMMMTTPEPGEEVEDPFQSTWDDCAANPDIICEEYVDEERELIGVRVIVPFDSLDELVDLSYDEVFEGADEVTIEESDGATTMRIVVYISDVGGEVAESSEGTTDDDTPEATLTPEDEEMQRQMLEMMDVEFLYRVTAPSPILEYSPQEDATYDEDENTVTWELDLLAEAESQEFSLSWETTGAASSDDDDDDDADAPEDADNDGESDDSDGDSDDGAGGLTETCSCIPSVILPGLALGGVLLIQRKKK